MALDATDKLHFDFRQSLRRIYARGIFKFFNRHFAIPVGRFGSIVGGFCKIALDFVKFGFCESIIVLDGNACRRP